jgi:hypothetical protein
MSCADLRVAARASAVELASGKLSETSLDEAGLLMVKLRNARDYPAAQKLGEAIAFAAPDDHRSRRIYAQALIEVGQHAAALDVLAGLRGRLPEDHPESIEARGLTGRAWKDIFMAAAERTPLKRQALQSAFDAYRGQAAEPDPNPWLALNTLALSAAAKRSGIELANDVDREKLARQVHDALVAVPEEERDPWYWGSLAEAKLALDDMDGVVTALGEVAQRDGTQFELASIERQFSTLWTFDEHPQGAQLLTAIRARLLEQPGGLNEISPAEVRQFQRTAASEKFGAEAGSQHYEAILGHLGAETVRWWQTGLQRAAAVCSVCAGGERQGTGWLAPAKLLGFDEVDGQVVVTNYHVVNSKGASGGFTPGDVDVIFEGIPDRPSSKVLEVLWESEPERHDVCVMRLADPIEGAEPLDGAVNLPLISEDADPARVYIIGYPGGRDLSFSFQDNELIDHEGPTAGKPQIEGVCRIHYRAPTEGGSSGSPVFNSRLWQVIGVHHKGGRQGMPRLNGKPGTYAANEAISIASIRDAIKGSFSGKIWP